MGRPQELSWDDLRYFLRAVEASTLAGAARALAVEHTTVGRRLTALERSLGGAVVLRGPEGLKLTPLGERLLPLAQEVERRVLDIQHAARSQTERVRLAVPSGFSELFTPGLARLREAHPRLALELISGARRVDLKKGEADLALRSGPVEDAELVARKLGESGWSLYASPHYMRDRVALEHDCDLAGHDVIGYDESLLEMPAGRWLEQQSTTARVVLRSREMTEMLAAARSGIGIALLPCILGDQEPALVRLTPRVLATRNVSLVYYREAKLSEAVRAVMQHVISVVQDNASRIAGVPAGRSLSSP
jgi:DNA-binding transcriptional LysR family regulator